MNPAAYSKCKTMAVAVGLLLPLLAAASLPAAADAGKRGSAAVEKAERALKRAKIAQRRAKKALTLVRENVGPQGPRGPQGEPGATGGKGEPGQTRVAGDGNSVAALELEGTDGIESAARKGWNGPAAGRLRISRAEPDNRGAENFLITPYQYGMAIDYPGVLEAWVSAFSVRSNPAPGGARFWVGNDDDTGGVFMNARNSGDAVWGEIASQAFTGAPSGPLRLRTVAASDGVEVWNGPSNAATRQLRFGPIGPGDTPGVGFGEGGDTALYNPGQGLLRSDGRLLADQGIGVGNSAPATTLGNVVRSVEVYDENGASLGFVPVYDSAG